MRRLWDDVVRDVICVWIGGCRHAGSRGHEAVQAAVEAIRVGAQEAVARADACRVPMPAYFATTVRYREHKDAYRRSFYPGAALEDDKTISFGTDNWYEMLRFYHFVL